MCAATNEGDGTVVAHPMSTGLSPREERRRIRIEMTQSQILDAAETAFATAGFHNTTIKSIAEQCEIAVGTLYAVFADKESLYEAVLRRRGSELTTLTENKAAEPGPDDTRLVELAELQIHFFRKYPNWTVVASGLVSGSRAAPSPSGSTLLFETGHRVVADVITSVIARGQHSGHLRSGDPHALALIYLGMLEAFHRLDSPGDTTQPQYQLAEFLDLVGAAFGAKKSPKK